LTLFDTVSTPKETTFVPGAPPADDYASMLPEPPQSSALVEIDPNNPPWGVLEAVFVWIASAVLLVLVPALAIIPYVLYQYFLADYEVFIRSVPTNKTVILISILSVIPVHLLTFGLAWVVITKYGKRPFWRALGWDWSPRFGFWLSAGLAFALLVMGTVIIKQVGGEATDLDHIINSSTAARLTTALLATATAPLIEEIIYRGIIYSALQRALGMFWAVLIVSSLFAFVHVFQYKNNLGVVAAISLLSLTLTLVRALTGRLLPCFVIHFIFNGLQSLYIIFEPYMQAPASGGEQKAAIVEMLSRSII
ncbi:MAG: type II CAAX endopeptidase family protein, partial [Pyrinomonadaceae bacterium]